MSSRSLYVKATKRPAATAAAMLGAGALALALARRGSSKDALTATKERAFQERQPEHA